MIKLLLVLVISIIVASLLFTILRKFIRFAFFVGIILITFVVISNIVFPESNILQKGKNYILEKTGSLIDKGKDKVTSYVIVEANETINDAKEGIIGGILD